ncbi:hypothetical protein Q7504_11540, partial [Glaesserella parasuis]|nr:hypothetical protein [Glaesserella parasuis]
ALTADQRNAIQQASAAGLGALIGASLGGDSNTVNQSAQMAWRTEKFNRQLHPDEKKRIKDLANGDKEKEARLTAAACALVHCSAQIPSDDPEYAKAKALEDLGNSAEFASERALLSKQVGTIGDDAFAAGTLKPMFNYNNVYRAKDYDDANLQVLTRVGGAAQSVGGVAATVFGVGICETGMGCIGGVPIAAYGVDNAVAGARTIYSGKYHSTIGAAALADLTGINPETAELIYSSPSMVFGAKPIAMGAAKATGEVANGLGKATNTAINGINLAKQTSVTLGELAKKYPKTTEGLVVGSISTGFDIYNGETSPEKTAMNFVLGRGLAGKSLDQQLAVNVIYKGIVSVNEKDSNEEILFVQGASATGSAIGSLIDFSLNKGGVTGLSKQVISNIGSEYFENKIESIPQDKNDKQGGEK